MKSLIHTHTNPFLSATVEVCEWKNTKKLIQHFIRYVVTYQI